MLSVRPVTTSQQCGGAYVCSEAGMYGLQAREVRELFNVQVSSVVNQTKRS